MGNHTIDCEFCGVDMRVFGSDCCEERKVDRTNKAEARTIKAKAQQAYLARFGIEAHLDRHWMGGQYISRLDVEDVIHALEQLEPWTQRDNANPGG